MGTELPPPLTQFHHPSYLILQKIFKFFGGAFHVLDPLGNIVFYSKQKAFKLKEDIRIYTVEDMSTELLVIRTDQIIDLGVTYHVHDPQQGGVHVGSLKREGLKSILRDKWLFLDPAGRQIGTIQEDSTAMALLRRLVAGWLLPAKIFWDHRQHAGLPVCPELQPFRQQGVAGLFDGYSGPAGPPTGHRGGGTAAGDRREAVANLPFQTTVFRIWGAGFL